MIVGTTLIIASPVAVFMAAVAMIVVRPLRFVAVILGTARR
jgi:hypothetical protein